MGDPAGKTGTPFSGTPQQAGAAFSVTVNATDEYFNLVSTNAAVSLYSNDVYGTPSTTVGLVKSLAGGTTSFSAMSRRSGSSDGAK